MAKRTSRHPEANRFGGYGWRPQLPDQRDFVFVPRVALVPPVVSLRSQCPSVYDQGQLGSCTANGIAFLYEFDQMKQHLRKWVPSRLFIYYNERVMEGTVLEDAGAEIRDGIKSIAQDHWGVCPESAWPYTISKFAKKPPASCYTTALKHQSLVYRAVPQVRSSIQAAVASGFPVVFGFTVYESFESDQVASDGMVPMPARTEAVLGGHCVCIVGYDDTKQCYEVRNSWGPNWGVGGYCWMPYRYIESSTLSSDLWVVSTVE